MQESSSGIIIFRRSSGERLYLLLHYHFKGDYWDFPRGNIKKGETIKQAAVRETSEETGFSDENLRFVKGFKENAKWFYRSQGQTVVKRVTYFLAETDREDVNISEEHIGFRWLNFKDALSLLKYRNSRRVLEKAEEFLHRNEGQAAGKAIPCGETGVTPRLAS